MIVDLYLNGEPVSKLTCEYEVSKAAIYTWKTELSSTPEVVKRYELKHDLSYIQIQKELAKLREENEVFKKYVTIFLKKIDKLTIKLKRWFIQKYRHEHKLTALLRVMKLSKSTFLKM